MSFCSFSKEYTENDYTLIENRFLTKYMPESDGFFVKVYLYGLLLCFYGDLNIRTALCAEIYSARCPGLYVSVAVTSVLCYNIIVS